MNRLSAFADVNGPILCIEHSAAEQRCVLALPGLAPPAWPHIMLPEPLPLRVEAWKHELRRRGLPEPALVAAAEEASAAMKSGEQGWTDVWAARLAHRPESWLDPDRSDRPGQACPNQAEPKQAGPKQADITVTHTAVAALLGALSAPVVAARSLRQGVIVLYCGHRTFTAFLVYRGRVYGVFEHTSRRDIADLLADLREFRLAWLPDEVVRLAGGQGCVFLRPVPEEAESFEPLFLVGPGRERLLAHGQDVAFSWDAAWTPCYGLLAGLAARCA